MSKIIPFNVKFRPQIESGDYKVETRDGKPVRIICWDMDSYNQIVALVANYPNYNGSLSEHIFSYGMNGRYSATAENAEDLFIVTPEPEMSEWELAIHRRLNLINGEDLSATELLEETKGMAAELLDLARNEFNKQIENDYREIIHNAYEKGKTDTLKDLPRWKSVINFSYGLMSHEKTFYNNTLGQLFHKGKKLYIYDLERLPGFKEEDHEQSK